MSFNWADSYDAKVSINEEKSMILRIAPFYRSFKAIKSHNVYEADLFPPVQDWSRLRSIIAPTLLVCAPMAAFI